MSTVFLFGAGASKPFGYATTLEFMAIAKGRKLRNPFGQAIEFFEGKKQDPDIEMVLSELQDLSNFIMQSKSPNRLKYSLIYVSANIPGANQLSSYSSDVEKLTREINELVYDTYWKAPNDEAKETYTALANTFSSPLDLFTTNYDLCIEHAFADEKSFTDGFGVYSRNFFWNPELYDGNLIRLYKLHGSVNWKRGPSGQIWSTPFHDRTAESDHVILYPGFKGEPTEQPFINLHQIFFDRLKQAKALVVVGFSFRDEYINRIINGAIKENEDLRVIIWNPVIPANPFPSEIVTEFKQPFNKELLAEIKSLGLKAPQQNK